MNSICSIFSNINNNRYIGLVQNANFTSPTVANGSQLGITATNQIGL